MVDTHYSATALIPVQSGVIGGILHQTVNAQDIHAFLEVHTRYDIWISRRIKTYGFQEGRDFTTFNSEQGPVRTIEYHVSLDMAKELSMVERTKKGKEARQYFLECERRAVALPDPVERYPELRAIRELLIVTAEARDEAALARQEAQAAEARAIRAEGKADMALADAHHMTISDFILANGLHRQFPESQYQRIAKWLGEFCDQWGLPTYPDPVVAKPWPTEKSYPLQAFATWLRMEQRKPHQVTLVKEKRHEQDR